MLVRQHVLIAIENPDDDFFTVETEVTNLLERIVERMGLGILNRPCTCLEGGEAAFRQMFRENDVVYFIEGGGGQLVFFPVFCSQFDCAEHFWKHLFINQFAKARGMTR